MGVGRSREHSGGTGAGGVANRAEDGAGSQALGPLSSGLENLNSTPCPWGAAGS